MSSSTPASPSSAPVAAVPAAYAGNMRSTPGFAATRTPVHLGLSVHSSAVRTTTASAAAASATAPRRGAPSLSIRTADGSRVSILNDCDDTSGSSADHKRCSSVPGITTPGSSPTSTSPFRAQSTPGATTPQQHQQQPPSMLPSLSTLVQAVHMVTSAAPPSSMAMKRSISTSSGVGHNSYHPYYSDPHSRHAHTSQSPVPMSAPAVSAPPSATPAPVPAYASGAPAGTRSTGKRRYKCVFGGCGKAFTTSGHLARHQRIHTGEKNFPCLFPGCSSRFSRQDNMMQHYRTHLSTKSRRNASPRKVVFVEPPSDQQYRAAHGLYPSPVYSGSHPIQHHPQHRPYGPPQGQQQQRTPASARAAVHPPQQQPRAAASSSRAAPFQQQQHGGDHRTSAHYGLPPVHMLSEPAAAGGSASDPHRMHHHAGMAKQSPAVAAAHPGAMSFY
ncbi:hypothetical protein EV175_006190 [Coemansia sp. RSA 1933]|nr:hypothetical protein EV175_006190 [Coemansia sp. RSA 1933]